MNKYFSLLVIVFILGLGAWYIASHHPLGNPISSPNTITYACNEGKSISASFNEGAVLPALGPDSPPVPTGSVSLTLSDGRSMTIAQTISADGTRYATEDESFVFWTKGNGALVLENNEEKSYIGCIRAAPEPDDANLSMTYANGQLGFSLNYPESYTVDESYKYQALGPGKDIYGTKFTIAASFAAGTNLGADSYISVEEIPAASECSAALFASPGTEVKTVTEVGTTYSVAMTSDAGAGNRYEETIYALPGTNPCIAVRYFIHYSVFENYPAGTITEFDQAALIKEFDMIRSTLVVNE